MYNPEYFAASANSIAENKQSLTDVFGKTLLGGAAGGAAGLGLNLLFNKLFPTSNLITQYAPLLPILGIGIGSTAGTISGQNAYNDAYTQSMHRRGY